MSSALFDTLGYSKRLEQLGFTREQAEGFAQLQREVIEDRLATKQDLRELEARLTINLTNRFGVMLAAAAAVAVLAALIKIL